MKKKRDVDLRQLLNAKKTPPVMIADKVASLTKNKPDDESDQDEESDLVIEMPTEDEERGKTLDEESNKSNYNTTFFKVIFDLYKLLGNFYFY